MISAILTFVVRIIFWIIRQLLILICSLLPSFDFTYLASVLELFYGICEKGLNFLYFCSGSTIFIFIDIWVALWTARHVVLPIINFTRKNIQDLF